MASSLGQGWVSALDTWYSALIATSITSARLDNIGIEYKSNEKEKNLFCSSHFNDYKIHEKEKYLFCSGPSSSFSSLSLLFSLQLGRTVAWGLFLHTNILKFWLQKILQF